MYPCDPISFKYMKIRGEASYHYAEIKKTQFVKNVCTLTGCLLHLMSPQTGRSGCHEKTLDTYFIKSRVGTILIPVAEIVPILVTILVSVSATTGVQAPF